MLTTYNYQNAATGASESLTMLDSVASLFYYKKVFGTSMTEDFQNAGGKGDILVVFKAAYAMAYPSLIGKESFEDFCARFRFQDLGPLSEEVSGILSSMAPQGEAGEEPKK